MLHLPRPPTEFEDEYKFLRGEDEYKSLRGEISPSTCLRVPYLHLLFLSKIQYLNLSYANFIGRLPNQLGNLSNLLSLDLGGNDFEGGPYLHSLLLSPKSNTSVSLMPISWARPIPPFLASLPKIQHFILFDANFLDILPPFQNLSNLLSLDLSYNYDLNCGNLEWLSHLSSLRHLELNSVNLSKAIHWSQAINKLPSLIHLNLRYCSLPPLTTPSFSPVNSSAPLAFLDLSDNDLTSSIYPWLFNFTTTLVHLDLSWNAHLNGSIPGIIGTMVSLTYRICMRINYEVQFEAFGNMTSLNILICLESITRFNSEAFGNMVSLTHQYMHDNQLGFNSRHLGTWFLLHISVYA
ncbi:hypothetical protein AAG906_005339 [Vitis piasezkii]